MGATARFLVMTRRVATTLVLATLAVITPACGDPEPPPGARAVTIETPDGEQLDALELGEGTRVAVLSHGATGTREGYFALMPVLADRGWRVIAYDARGVGASTGESGPDREVDLRAVVDHARSSGAESIALVGASLGAALSLAQAKALDADAVVSLSGFLSGGSGGELATLLTGIEVFLAAAEDNEPYATDAREMGAALDVEPSIVSGDGHGTGMFADHPELMDEIAAFLEGTQAG